MKTLKANLRSDVATAGGEPRPERFLCWADLLARGIISSKTQARRLWEAGQFPKPVHLSERVIAWKESEIEAHLQTLAHRPGPARGVVARQQAVRKR
jgi:predicted DNA-binding transcriptional regulator AlpA